MEQRQIIVDGTATLLKAAGRAEVARVVHVSSVGAVGCTQDARPVDETNRWEGLAYPQINYLYCKREAEERALAAAYGGIPVTIVNPTTLIGGAPGDDAPRGMIANASGATKNRVAPGGTSFADVRDVALGTCAALDRGRVGERYLLGGHNLSWSEFSNAVRAHQGRSGAVHEYPSALGTLMLAACNLIDTVGLSRPRWAPELYRAWGWFTFASSAKAEQELGYRVRPLSDTLARSLGPRSAVRVGATSALPAES